MTEPFQPTTRYPAKAGVGLRSRHFAEVTDARPSAAWFEVRMPWDPKWRRSDVVGVTARAIDVVVETGEAGPTTAIGINLPNDQRIREIYGSKSVSLANITHAYEKAELPAYRKEFCWSEEEAVRAERWGPVASEATTAIHEVLGHGSGRVADHLNGQPQLALKEQYSSIEEARADLVALYFLPEPKIGEIGLVPKRRLCGVRRRPWRNGNACLSLPPDGSNSPAAVLPVRHLLRP